jgi:DNA-binding response OmpR family regulator
MKKKILVVDDEYTIRELVDLTLTPEYDVIKAENGKEGLEMIEENPDLVILDIMMPQMDGYEVCEKLKTDEKTRQIPVIMLTAKHSMEDLKKAVKVDVDEYITKPFEPEFLKKRVDAYLTGDKKDIKRKLFQYDKSLHYVKEREED